MYHTWTKRGSPCAGSLCDPGKASSGHRCPSPACVTTQVPLLMTWAGSRGAEGMEGENLWGLHGCWQLVEPTLMAPAVYGGQHGCRCTLPHLTAVFRP